MSMDAATLDARLAKLIARFSATFTWGSTDYACTAEGASQTRETELSGELPAVDVILHTRKALFTSGSGPFPKRGDSVTYNSRLYRVERDEFSPDFGVELTLYLVADHG